MTRIGTRVLVYGLIMAWLPLLLIGGFVIYTVGPRLEAAVAEKAFTSARTKANAVNQILLGVNDRLHAVAATSHERLKTMDTASRQALFYDLLKTNPLLEEVYLMDTEGKSLDWVSRWRLTGVGQPEDAVLKIGEKQSFITNVYREKDGRLTSTICVPIRSIGLQHIIGYLGGKVRLRGIADLAFTHGDANGGTSFIVDQSGELVGHEDFSEVLGGTNVRASLAVKTFVEARLTANSAAGQMTQRYINYRGQDVLGAYVPVGNWGWAVVVEEKREEALAPVQDWMLRFHFAGIFLSLSAIGASYIISRKITGPIEALEQGVNKVARGEWEHDLPGAGQDEIGQLVTAFNKMLKEQRLKKEMEEQLIHTDKMATLGIVATSVAHEINNPLAIISGYSEDMLDRLREGDQEALCKDGERYLTIICEQTKRCKAIIRVWLDTARLPHQSSEVVSVIEVVDAVRELVIYRGQKKRINLQPTEIVGYGECCPVVLVNQGEFQQVLLNLFMNALDACAAGDTVAIKVEAADGYCLMHVIDSGVGISQTSRERLGESFYTTKPPGQGTGLGLYVARELLGSWGGTLTIDSEGEGLGTVATIKLPLTTVKEEKT